MSVIPLKADIHQRGLHVRLVPGPSQLYAATSPEDLRGREVRGNCGHTSFCAQSEGGSLAVSFGAEGALFFALMLAHQFFDFDSAFAHR